MPTPPTHQLKSWPESDHHPAPLLRCLRQTHLEILFHLAITSIILPFRVQFDRIPSRMFSALLPHRLRHRHQSCLLRRRRSEVHRPEWHPRRPPSAPMTLTPSVSASAPPLPLDPRSISRPSTPQVALPRFRRSPRRMQLLAAGIGGSLT